MGEKTPATTNTNQLSTTNPWSPATPLLQNLISQYGGVNTGVTADQSNASQNLINAAGSVPNEGDNATNAVNNLFNSSTAPQAGMLSDAYKTLQGNIGGTASGANLNPYSTPGFGDALNTMTNDITNQVKGVYAGSGRSPSGAGSFAQSLGRGLTQGEAPVIQNEANYLSGQQQNAAQNLFTAGGSTASGITNQNQTQLGNGLQGLSGAGMLSGLYTNPAQTQLSAANTAYGQPYANLSPMMQAAMGLGGMGSTSNGTGTSTQTPANNPLMNILGGVSGAAGLAGMMFSDRRLKTDIRRVGMLDDGQNVYSYRYKGADAPTIGLMADEVEDHAPEAVHEIGGYKAVDYSVATRHAGMLNELREAA